MNEGRISWIDCAKGIGILLVILSHAGVSDWEKSMIFTFHMPVFFFISGFLFNYGKYRSDRAGLIRNKITRLIYPFIISFAVLSLVWAIIKIIVDAGAIPYDSAIFHLTITDILLSLLYGNGAFLNPAYENLALLVDPPLWFLPALFCSLLVLFAVLEVYSRGGPVIGLFSCIGIIGTGLICSRYFYLPWGLDIGCITLVFTGAGYLAGRKENVRKLLMTGYLLPVCLILVVIACMINGYVDLNTREYQNPAWFFIGGLAGSLMVCQAARLVSGVRMISGILQYLGNISLFIMVFHVPLMVFFIGPLRVINPGLYNMILGSWCLWFVLSLGLSLITWQVAERIPAIKSLYYGG